jgi:hypothetical protein
MEQWRYIPTVLYHDTRRRWVVSSRPGRFTLRVRAPVTNRTVCLVGLRAGVDTLEEGKSSAPAGNQTLVVQPLVAWGCSPTGATGCMKQSHGPDVWIARTPKLTTERLATNSEWREITSLQFDIIIATRLRNWSPMARKSGCEGSWNQSFNRVSGRGLMKSNGTVSNKSNFMSHTKIFMQSVAPVGGQPMMQEVGPSWKLSAWLEETTKTPRTVPIEISARYLPKIKSLLYPWPTLLNC